MTTASISCAIDRNDASFPTDTHCSRKDEQSLQTTADEHDATEYRNPLMNLFGSNSTKRFDQNETELDDIRVLSFVSREREPGFDDCPEYSYDSDNENTSQNDCHETHGSDDAHGSLQAYILGKKYHPVHDYTLRREDEISLFWFTYRCDFPEIKPYRIQSDAGWGCMLRSAQMMLCQVLRLHYKSRTWRPPKSLAARRQDPFVSRLMTWFADFPSTTECFYSFQNMVAAGLNYDKLPGEWYGPGTVSFVIRDLVAIHDQQRQELDKTLFRVHVASQGTVYRDEVRRLMIQGANTAAALTKGGTASRPGAAHPLDHAAWEEDHLEKVPDWDTALLLLIPLRLGLKTFNLDYVRALAHTFSLPQSVGVLGGRPRGARYFYGAFSDGSKIFGLDPHTVQAAPQRASVSINGELSSMIDLSDENLRSIHTAYPESISLEKMDPSITLGFYCENERDLQFIFESVQQWKTENPGSPELFTTANYSPDYAANISSTMKKIMLSSSSLLDTEEDQISDEDDYVML